MAPTCDQNPVGSVCFGEEAWTTFLLDLRFFLFAITITNSTLFLSSYIIHIIAKFTTFCKPLVLAFFTDNFILISLPIPQPETEVSACP